MNIFLMQYKNELQKITKRKKFIVLLLIEVIFCVISGASSYLMGKASNQIFVTNFAFSALPLNMLGFFIQVYIPLIIIMNASDLFNTEMNDLTIKASFMRPISRFKIYFSKVLSLFTVGAIYLCVLLITTTLLKHAGRFLLSGSAYYGRGNIFRDFFVYAMDLIPLLIMVLFIAMMMQFFKSTTLAMLICIVIYVFLNLIALFQPNIGIMLFTSYMQWHKLFFGISIPFTSMIEKIALLSGYFLIFSCIGYYIFERREL